MDQNQSIGLAHRHKAQNNSVKAISDGGSPTAIQSGISGTCIEIFWESADRRGWFPAELADVTVLTNSRQPFLDAARVLIALGCDPNIMLFGRRKGSVSWSLRGRLGKAAKLTVGETKTALAI